MHSLQQRRELRRLVAGGRAGVKAVESAFPTIIDREELQQLQAVVAYEDGGAREGQWDARTAVGGEQG
jgi:hypothetical protein